MDIIRQLFLQNKLRHMFDRALNTHLLRLRKSKNENGTKTCQISKTTGTGCIIKQVIS